jgi:hypothetical protein
MITECVQMRYETIVSYVAFLSIVEFVDTKITLLRQFPMEKNCLNSTFI